MNTPTTPSASPSAGAVRAALALAGPTVRFAYEQTDPALSRTRLAASEEIHATARVIDRECGTDAASQSARIAVLREALRDLRDAVNPIIDPSVTTLTVDGTLDMINASQKADKALSATSANAANPSSNLEQTGMKLESAELAADKALCELLKRHQWVFIELGALTSGGIVRIEAKFRQRGAPWTWKTVARAEAKTIAQAACICLVRAARAKRSASSGRVDTGVHPEDAWAAQVNKGQP